MGSDAIMEFRAKGDPKVCLVLITLKLCHVSMDHAMLDRPDQEQGDILSRFIHFLPFTYLIVTPDRPDRSDRLSAPALGVPMLSLDIARSRFDITYFTPHSPTQITTHDLYEYLRFRI